MLSSRMVTSEQLSVFFVTGDSRRSRTSTISAFYEKDIHWTPTRRHLEDCPPLRLRVHGRLPQLRCLERSVRSRQDRPVAPAALDRAICWTLWELGVMGWLRSGWGGGAEGFRRGHLLDLVGFGDACGPLVDALTDFMNLLLRGGCPAEVRPILFGGNMIALCKDNGGLRPIAVGYIWRRLAAKCANRYAVARLAAHFAPLQLGIGVPGGCEAAVHATRRFASSMGPDQVLVKLDFANAFNTLRRDVMLKSVLDIIPELYPFVLQAYSTPSVLKFGDMLLSSQMGPQQGDPLGPLLFSLPLQPVLHSLESALRVGFLDDLTLGARSGPYPVTWICSLDWG